MNQTEEITPTLADVLAKYQIKLSPGKIRRLEIYCAALWRWNEKLNLTRHTDYEKFVTRDVVDSLALSALLQKGEHVLDVGTGGGVPGVVLAILRPDLVVELCDSTGKKVMALAEILDEVGLNLNLWHAKAEDLLQLHRFHSLIVRAVSKMDRLLEIFAPKWFAFDRLLLVKGPSWVEERGEARHYGRLEGLALRKLAEYPTPGEAERESVILQICRKSRFAELQKRADDLVAGLPIAERAEAVGVDNRPPSDEGKPSFRSAFGKKRTGQRDAGRDGGSRAKGESDDKRSDQRSEERRSGDKQGGERRSGGSRKSFGKKVDSEVKRGKGWVHPETPFKPEESRRAKKKAVRGRGPLNSASGRKSSRRGPKKPPRPDSD